MDLESEINDDDDDNVQRSSLQRKVMCQQRKRYNTAKDRFGNFRGGAEMTYLSQGCVDPNAPNLARTYGDHHNIALLVIYCCIFTHGRLKV